MDLLFYIHNAIINKLRILRNKYFFGFGVCSQINGKKSFDIANCPLGFPLIALVLPLYSCVSVYVCVMWECAHSHCSRIFPPVPISHVPCPCPSLTTNA